MAGVCRFKLFYVLCLIYFSTANEDNTEDQLSRVIHKALERTARNCMSKANATEADLESLRQDPPYPEKASCILKCLLEKVGVVKNNKYSRMGFLAAVSPFVITKTNKLQHMKMVSENCDKEISEHEPSSCQLGNEIVTCIFKYAPELQFKS